MQIVTRTLVDRLEAEHLITRRYVLAPGSVMPCTVGSDDIYSLSRFHTDFSGVTRVDLVRGTQRLPDIPFDAAAGCVYLLTPARMLLMLPTMKLPLALIAVSSDSGERTLATYTMDHTAP